MNPVPQPRPVAHADAGAAAPGAGEPDAFDAQARAAMPRLLGTARRWLGQGFAAEEAVAEALYRAFVHRHSYAGSAAFATWVHRILCRVVADRYRAQARRRRHEAALERRARPRPVPRPGQALAERERLAQVRGAIERLPERQRLVLLLHAWEGLDLAEVAEVLGMRYRTVKSNLHHARRALVRLLEEA